MERNTFILENIHLIGLVHLVFLDVTGNKIEKNS